MYLSAESRKEREEKLLHIELDEHFICSESVTGEHISWYRTLSHAHCNLVAGAFGVMPLAVHLFHHVCCCGHIFQLIVKERTLFQKLAICHMELANQKEK